MISRRVRREIPAMRLSGDFSDEINAVLGAHYGLTEEELDFIVNDDVKHRMGDELNADG